MVPKSITYKQAGVDIQANTVWVDAIRRAMAGTHGPRVMNRHNAFAGLFRLQPDQKGLNYRKPVLVGCADGVGTKVLIAIEMNRLSTIGIDLVAMNVNDLITCGAEPLFFLDYLAVNRLEPRRLLEVIEGIAEGCRQAGCALLGGETAEMPDLYQNGHLDLAGFAVGVVEHGHQIDGTRITPGDQVIGLTSSGVHSNGYTLVRRLVARGRCKFNRVYDELGESLGDALLRPTRIYVKAVLKVLRHYRTKKVVLGMAHITGGGLRENIARILPPGCDAKLRRSVWQPPRIFDFLRRLGTDQREMFRVFNMGIGFVLVVKPLCVRRIKELLRDAGERPLVIGRIVRGNGQVRIE